MNLRRLTATAALVIAAMGVTAGTAYADPAPAPATVGYESKVIDKTVVTTLTGGLFELKDSGKSVDVKDTAGNVIINLPMAYNLDNLQFPILGEIKDAGSKLVMTPTTDRAKAIAQPSLLHNVASVDENQKAMSAFSSQLGIAMAIGGLVGLTVGAVIGGVLGLLGIFGGPTVIATVLTGIAVGAGVGSIAGTIVAGGPTLVIAGIDLINTLNAPPGTSKFAPGR